MMIPAEFAYAILFVVAMSIGVYFAVRTALKASIQEYLSEKEKYENRGPEY